MHSRRLTENVKEVLCKGYVHNGGKDMAEKPLSKREFDARFGKFAVLARQLLAQVQDASDHALSEIDSGLSEMLDYAERDKDLSAFAEELRTIRGALQAEVDRREREHVQ
jgi:hypothetical protein